MRRVAPSWLEPVSYPTSMNGIIVLFIRFLKLQKFEVRNTSEKKPENVSKIEKNLKKMRCCVTHCGQTDLGSSQKTFLAFSRTSKLRH